MALPTSNVSRPEGTVTTSRDIPTVRVLVHDLAEMFDISRRVEQHKEPAPTLQTQLAATQAQRTLPSLTALRGEEVLSMNAQVNFPQAGSKWRVMSQKNPGTVRLVIRVSSRSPLANDPRAGPCVRYFCQGSRKEIECHCPIRDWHKWIASGLLTPEA